jgi:hypothetical protein
VSDAPPPQGGALNFNKRQELIMKRNKILPNPLGERILAYIDENNTNLTALSLGAGLSAGSVRQIVLHPERRPTLETCLRLAFATRIPSDEILELAGFEPGLISEARNPDRSRVLQFFDQLPTQKSKRAFVNIARDLAAAFAEE